MSEVQESLTLKIPDEEETISNKTAEVRRSVSSEEEAMSTKITAIEISVANIRTKVERLMKVQPCLSK